MLYDDSICEQSKTVKYAVTSEVGDGKIALTDDVIQKIESIVVGVAI